VNGYAKGARNEIFAFPPSTDTAELSCMAYVITVMAINARKKYVT